jgi:UDP-2,4-diacetamido-2,4,6-trideoxy-beta-L-altropyranose hydrolase
MRCLALAQAAQGQGLDVRLAGRVHVPWVRERLCAECVPLLELADAVPHEENPADMLRQLAQTGFAPSDTWVVLDGYHFTCACQQAVRDAGYHLLFIDDYAHLPEYSCDILLNQNPGAEALPYAGDIGQKLLGPRYALLRREFREARERLPHTRRNVPPQNILVTLGGGDFIEYLENIAQHMSIPAMEGRAVRVIQGAMNAERIKQAFVNCPARLEILPRVTDMPSLLLSTDLCVTAGGSTCWELCCLEVPFLTVAVAENQREIVRGMEDAGTAMPFTKAAFATALDNADERAAAQTIVDGKGTLTILAECIASLRYVTTADIDFLFHLANTPSVRAVSFHDAAITRDEHVRCFQNKLQQNSFFFIVEYNQEPCGYVHFSGNMGWVDVSIVLSPEARGKKVALVSLQRACHRFFVQEPAVQGIRALVKTTNQPSMKFFEHAGFIRHADEQHDGICVAHFSLATTTNSDTR